jgi:hypothetical protein
VDHRSWVRAATYFSTGSFNPLLWVYNEIVSLPARFIEF